MSERVIVDYCKHSIPPWAVEEDCRICHQKATHKVEETSGPATFHPLTAYLCCGCFEMVVRYDCSKYPYDIDNPEPVDEVPFVVLGNNEPIPAHWPEELKAIMREKRGE